MKHDLFKTKDNNAPRAIQDGNGEVVLALCKTCGGCESTLPTDCPGCLMTEQQHSEIEAGRLDFKNGKWEAT